MPKHKLKIFVSSRMDEMHQARKVVVEAIHSAGHTPIYMEIEPWNETTEKEQMDTLLNGADAFILLHHLTAGSTRDALKTEPNGPPLTPIEYEFRCFRKQNEEGRILVLGQDIKSGSGGAVQPEGRLTDLLAEIQSLAGEKPNLTSDIEALNAIIMRTFNGIHAKGESKSRWETLHQRVIQWLGLVERLTFKPKTRPSNRYVVRYDGFDAPGTISAVSLMLFKDYGFDIDYISMAGRPDRSSVYITGCPNSIEKFMDGENYNERLFMDHLSLNLKGLLMRLFRETGSDKEFDEDKVRVRVKIDTPPKSKYQIYFKLLCIDSPGVVSNLTRVLCERDLNVDEMAVRPLTDSQSGLASVALWLTSKNAPLDTSQKTRSVLHQLETEIQLMIGVRSFRSRIILLNSHEEETNSAP